MLRLLALLTLAQAPDQTALNHAFDALERREYTVAEKAFREILGRNAASAEAMRGLGRVLNARGDFTAARQVLEGALALHQAGSHGSKSHAQTLSELAYAEWGSGKHDAALALYQRALALFESAGDHQERAKTLYNIVLTTSPSGNQRAPRLQAAWEAAERAGDRRLMGKIRHAWGDTLWLQGDLRGAVGHLEQASALLDRPADRGDRARVWISMARIYIAHRHYGQARSYYLEALDIHRALGDRQAIVYSLLALAGIPGEPMKRRRQMVQEAEELANQTGSASLISNALNGLANVDEDERLYAAARKRMERSLALYPDTMGTRLLRLARILLAEGEHPEALVKARQALAAAGRLGASPAVVNAHDTASRALNAMGRGAEALEQLRMALELRERLRGGVLPTDALKRGYDERAAELTGYAVELFFRHGLHEEGLAAAEQARARAFLDLLASRTLLRQLDSAPGRGGALDLPSAAMPPAISWPAIRQTASKTALLASWVTPEATFLWLLDSRGVAQALRVPIGAGQLEELAARASSIPRAHERRGPELARRELSARLVAPLSAALARAAGQCGGRLTIVPHGALSGISFAALRQANGRYLVEDFAIGYLPAIGMPAGTAPRQPAQRGYLLVAAPHPMPRVPGGATLPALPGARREVRALARTLANASPTVLEGAQVTEANLRQAAAGHRVIHMATHSVLNHGQPLESFLAMANQSDNASGDGRFTAGDVYGLRTSADLVVLSACSSAAGQRTGDGILGLTRAFFFAGAKALVATLWDVADQPTADLMRAFYQRLHAGTSARQSLRGAQLEIIAALRQGRLLAPTTAGPVALPEDPALWAGFIYLGLD